MGYADHDDGKRRVVASEPDILDRTAGAIGILVRLVGLALLCVGIAVALKVMAEAFTLYNDPATIERFANAIESGSNLDKVFAPMQVEATRGIESGSQELADTDARAQDAQPQAHSLRLSYFAAWFVVLALLVVVSGIAMSVVSAGGRLALGNLSLRRQRDG